MRLVITIGVILKILVLRVVSISLSETKLHSTLLDHDTLKLSWLIDWSRKEVMFNIDNAFTADNEQFSFGFSKRGKKERSDWCIFMKDTSSTFNVAMDAYMDDNQRLHQDYQQDCKLLRMDEKSVAFKRKFDTCDAQDLLMHEGTMYVLWARGNVTVGSGTKPNDLHGHYGSISKMEGMHMLQLLRPDKIRIMEKQIEQTIISLKNVTIPAKETTYWCHIKRLGDFIKTKHHIIQFEPIVVAESAVHHMEVFHCEAPVTTEIPLYDGDCDQLPAAAKVCSRVISLWAMGASSFTYPPEAGLPIGGPDYNPFIRLEVHYNNPQHIAGMIDGSGIKIKYVSKLRKYDAAIMELGLEYTDKMAIPPGVVAFPLTGYCIAECTHIALPSAGITVFGSQLHTHLRGVRVLTRHFRAGVELQELNRDDYFSQHFQEIRYLRRKPKVLPGDALVTTCYYDTEAYTNTTLGGFSLSDEMCVNYIQYYPATKLELCKSAVSEKTLENYFSYMQQKEHQSKVSPTGARSENYRSIEWTKTHVDELFATYVQEPISMSCNRSDGTHFGGHNWEGVTSTPVQLQVTMHPAACSKYNPFGVIPLEQGRCGYLGECIY